MIPFGANNLACVVIDPEFPLGLVEGTGKSMSQQQMLPATVAAVAAAKKMSVSVYWEAKQR